jgi:hypothetical protein
MILSGNNGEAREELLDRRSAIIFRKGSAPGNLLLKVLKV